MPKYQTLKQLVSAIETGDAHDVIATLDNDQVTFREDGADDSGPDYEDLLDLHPSEVQEQALEALGINVEWV